MTDKIMKTMRERIRERKGELEVNADLIAEKCGVDRTTVFRWINGKINGIRVDKIAILSEILSVSPLYLMGLSDSISYPIETKRFPLLGNVACGEPIFADEEFECYVEAGADIKADFCLKCKGDSMTNARINDGDIVFIREQSTVTNGEIAVVIIDDEATLKRVFYYPEQSKLVLQAENPRFEPFVYIGEELDQVRIIGKAVAFQSDVR